MIKNGRYFKHGKTKTSTYNIWATMKARCRNPNHIGYKHYGGRGITYCNEWKKFTNFLEDMGEKPEGYTLERKDNNLGYNKENCTWATYKEQNRNRSNTFLINYKGINRPLAAVCEELNISYAVVHLRIVRGWSSERAINTKIISNKWKPKIYDNNT